MKGEAHNSLLWSGVQQFVTFGIQFVLGIVLARLLNPYDYGLIAMQGIFFAISNAFIDFGLEGALIQKKECNKTDLNTAFLFSLTMALSMYVLLFFAAPIIADFYHAPILGKMLRFSALVFFFNSLGLAPKALLQRQLRFKELAMASTSITLLSGLVALYMAYHGYAYWSLIGQSLLSAALITGACILYARWLPSWQYSIESFRHLVSFGLPMLFTTLVNAVYNNIYSLVVGRFYTARQLGLYERANNYSSYVSYSLSGLSMRALYPLLSRVQDDMVQLKESTLRILHASAFIVVPINVFFMVKAEDLIQIVLTEKWLEMAPLMQVLCISSMAYVVTNLHFNLFKAVGRTQILFICELIKKILGVLVLLVTFRYGLLAMVWGLLVYAIVNILISSLFVYRFMDITLMDQMRQVHIVAINGLIALVVCWLVSCIISNLYLRFGLSFVVYFSVYASLGWIEKDKAIDFLKGYFKTN
ncbi:Membrane protein involved in the export of O-antigen and teichoic acid [Xylanibacter ruminicola]|uniref:Membrane protein involved in the export of O-antigen and teichoic acid n=1 Tax=Xylanibacter ruminicola TaxID=839 RepID=A0A1H4DQN6_XYLRU|nr:lipopolysaccharide biosynthesis protein [Xylanibacter ruminicola]SEA75083.1 Membrane protein involved in the export of O-antigen and teichoic acid [Xylanibacter ruminicola]